MSTILNARIMHRMIFAQPKILSFSREGEGITATRIGSVDPLTNAAVRGDDIAYNAVIDPKNVFYREESGAIITLAAILAEDNIIFDDVDAQYEFIRAAYPEDFTNVDLEGWFSHGSTLADNTVVLNAIIQGENLYESGDRAVQNLIDQLCEYRGSTAYEKVTCIVDGAKHEFAEIGIEFDNGGGLEDVDSLLRDELYNCDEGDAIGDLVSNTSAQFVRYELLMPGETEAENIRLDDGLDLDNENEALREWAKKLLSSLGISADEDNVKLFLGMMNEEYRPGEWLTLSLFARVEMQPFYESGENTVTIDRPYLWLGNIHMGSGWLSEGRIEGSITVPRARLFHDSEGPGYGVDETCGLYHPAFEKSDVTFSTNEG